MKCQNETVTVELKNGKSNLVVFLFYYKQCHLAVIELGFGQRPSYDLERAS